MYIDTIIGSETVLSHGHYKTLRYCDVIDCANVRSGILCFHVIQYQLVLENEERRV